MSALGRLRRALIEPARPLVAVEVRSRTLGVVRLARESGRPSLGGAACLELPEGALRPSMTEPNLVDEAAVRATLRAALERAGVPAGRRAALIVPDPVVRLALVPARELAGRRGEAEELLRFRLRKTLPFEVREAHVAIAWLPAQGGEPMALAGAVFGPVLRGYEETCAALGLHVGLVEPACLALHDAALAGRPGDRLLVNWDDAYVSLLVSRSGVPVLIRTLGAELASRPDEVAREVAATVVYYRERLGGTGLVGAAVRSAALSAAEAVGVLEAPLGFAPEPLDPWAALGGAPALADAGQALAGAAACLSRWAA